MARVYRVYDTENGRVVSEIKRVANACLLAGGELTSGSASVTVTSTTGLWPGMLLIGKGITTGTTVLSVDTPTAFTMSAVATATGSSLQVVALSYIPYKADGTLEVREVHLEHYRDLFDVEQAINFRTDYVGQEGGIVKARGSQIMKASVIPTGNVAIEGFVTPVTGYTGTTALVAREFADTLDFTVSDVHTHTPPREQTQKCSFVHFILEDGTLLPVLRMPSFDIVPVS